MTSEVMYMNTYIYIYCVIRESCDHTIMLAKVTDYILLQHKCQWHMVGIIQQTANTHTKESILLIR